MNSISSVSYVAGAAIKLTGYCRQFCSYCGFRSAADNLPTLETIKNRLDEIRNAKGTQIIFLTGEEPQEFPETQLALHRYEYTSFMDYLHECCMETRKTGMFPTISMGYPDSFTCRRLQTAGCSLMINLVPDSLPGPGEAHCNAQRRTPSLGDETVENAHNAEIPYHLNLLIGIGECEEKRLSRISGLGELCAADPYLQDIRLTPFQPIPGTPMHARPPLPFDAVAKAVAALRRAFPVHYISVPVQLFYRFPELTNYGMNDLGHLPCITGDPTTPGFNVPGVELLKKRLLRHNVSPVERMPLSTSVVTAASPINQSPREPTEIRIQEDISKRLELSDNGWCFICGSMNPAGLRLKFEVKDEKTCFTSWLPSPAYQGYSGIVHGGMISTLLDEAMAQSLSNKGIRAVTADMRIKFVRPAFIGSELNISGSHNGSKRNIHFTRATASDSYGNLIAQAEGRFMEIAENQSETSIESQVIRMKSE